ncbi:OmpA family protein [Candidatus Babeliales bacterium]|nr:OmpA family protein [Candidatus Babeliales bacterium]
MIINKRVSLYFFCVLSLVLFGAGCGKKKEVVADKKETSKTLALGDQTNNIPLVKEEVEDFLVNGDDDNISEFAFIDEDNEGKEDLKDLYAVADSSDSGTLVASTKEDFFGNEKDESYVSWQDYDDESTQEKSQFKEVLFDLNKNTIKEDQKENLKADIELAKKAVLEEGRTVAVHGHCCKLGAPSYNLSLSEKRANVIKNEMVKNGIPEYKIKTVGCGQEIPAVVINETGKSKKEVIELLSPNRRSEILITN